MNRLDILKIEAEQRRKRERFIGKIVKYILNIFLLALALIPTWAFFYIKNALEPNGFWQNLVVYGVGVYFFGGAQFVLIFMYLAWLAYSYDKI